MTVNLWSTALSARSSCKNDSRPHPERNAAIESAASTMSERYRSSRRIDDPGAVEHRLPDLFFEARLGHEVNAAAEKRRQFTLHLRERHEPDSGRRLELDQDVYVAVGPEVFAQR